MKWVTRARPHIDRCATAWLLRRFVDPKADIVFVRAGEPLPPKATPFDMPGVRHGHQGDRCTFEVVAAEHGLLKKPGLQRMAALVHDLDFHVLALPESAGVDAALKGWLLREPDDQRVLAHSADLFDALLAYYEGGVAR